MYALSIHDVFRLELTITNVNKQGLKKKVGNIDRHCDWVTFYTYLPFIQADIHLNSWFEATWDLSVKTPSHIGAA